MTEASYLTTTRTAYDTVAVDYAALLRDELDRRPLDRAMLATFAELVQADGGGQVADIGCGPGRVTAHLQALGVTAFGIDLSPQMIAVARQTYPGLRFDEGSMHALDLADGTLDGVVAWYSVIHTPPEHLPSVFAEFHRVLVPGGHLLLAFQVGDGWRRISQAYGHELALDAYSLSPDHVVEQLGQAGFVEIARLLRRPSGMEKLDQAYVLLRKPGQP